MINIELDLVGPALSLAALVSAVVAARWNKRAMNRYEALPPITDHSEIEKAERVEVLSRWSANILSLTTFVPMLLSIHPLIITLVSDTVFVLIGDMVVTVLAFLIPKMADLEWAHLLNGPVTYKRCAVLALLGATITLAVAAIWWIAFNETLLQELINKLSGDKHG